MNYKPFYISSWGGSATGWLAHSLSRHPDIVAWHGCRSLPPYGAGKNDIPAEEFVEGLRACAENVRGAKVFGSVHGYHGVSAKPSIDKCNGRFSYIMRHPVHRISSLFSNRYFRKFPSQKDKFSSTFEMYNHISSVLDGIEIPEIRKFPDLTKKDNLDFARIKRFLNNKFTSMRVSLVHGNQNFSIYGKVVKNKSGDYLTREQVEILEYFSGMCASTISHDLECFQNCHINQAIKMEKIVSSKDYFADIFAKHVSNEVKITEKYLSNIFSTENDINKHSVSKTNTDDLKSIISSPLNDLLNIHINAFGKNEVLDMYAKLDYDLF